MAKQDDELPKLFRVASKIAMHCVWGIVVLFFALKIPFINEGVNKTFLNWVYTALILVSIPAFMLAGPGIMKVVRNIKNSNNGNK